MKKKKRKNASPRDAKRNNERRSQGGVQRRGRTENEHGEGKRKDRLVQVKLSLSFPGWSPRTVESTSPLFYGFLTLDRAGPGRVGLAG